MNRKSHRPMARETLPVQREESPRRQWGCPTSTPPARAVSDCRGRHDYRRGGTAFGSRTFVGGEGPRGAGAKSLSAMLGGQDAGPCCPPRQHPDAPVWPATGHREAHGGLGGGPPGHPTGCPGAKVPRLLVNVCEDRLRGPLRWWKPEACQDETPASRWACSGLRLAACGR